MQNAKNTPCAPRPASLARLLALALAASVAWSALAIATPAIAQQAPSIPPPSAGTGAPAAGQVGKGPAVGPYAGNDQTGNPQKDLLTDGRADSDRIDGFNEAVPAALPMTPEMIERFREIYNRTQDATLARPDIDAIVDADLVSLEPGAPPPTFTVSPGVASVLSFFDASGQPWPIAGYVVGNESGFQILRLSEDQSNFITITPRLPTGWTNLVVSLEGEATPVVLTVRIDRTKAHYRRDVQVMAMGPNARPSPAVPERSGPRPGDGSLLSFLAATEFPQGTRAIDVTGADARAWVFGDDLYIRSRLALISPSWTASMTGPDGVRIYRLARTPVALFSDRGRITRARIALP